MSIWDNIYVLTGAYFVLAVLSIVIFLAIFEVVTKYNDWQEIKNGNISVALATGGKIVAVAIILAFSIYHNDSLWSAFIWGAFGFGLQLIAYYLFEFFTPQFKVDEEIEKDNRAVGLLSFLISIGIALVVGASIT
ncbi:DUF350 domain-containing protein [Vulcanibacillus modesticaldus]|uniref:DUF350 domain-containing protein n=1 Tax=Vulcanibacillus modesticaldus TaxID=337097 RepID=UPI000A3FBB14|nr:DUF350 domain-containing protein [Vulcanibacillus modesticaldus]